MKINRLMLIGLVILGLALVVISIGIFDPHYRQAPIKAPVVNIGSGLAFPGASIGDFYAIFSAPGTSQVQLPNYPFEILLFGGPAGSSIFIGGYFFASCPINFTISSLLPGRPEIFRVQNSSSLIYLAPNAYYPWFYQIMWENSNTEPIIVIGNNFALDPITPSFNLNSNFVLGLGLSALGLLVFASGVITLKVENKGQLKLPKAYRNTFDVLNASLTVWNKVFPKVTLTFAFLASLQIVIVSLARGFNQIINFELLSLINPFYSPFYRNYLLLQVITFTIPFIYILVVIFSFLLTLIAEGVAIKYAYDQLTQKEDSLQENLKVAASLSGKMLGASVLLSMVLIAGLIVFVVPGIYLAVTLSLIIQVIIIERTTITKAIARSIELTRGKRLDTFKLLIFGSTIAISTLLLAYLIAFKIAPTVPTIITPGDYFNTNSITSLITFLPSIIGFALIIGSMTAITIPLFRIIMTTWYHYLNKQNRNTAI